MGLLLLLVEREVNLNSAGYGATYHGVVTDTEEAHHFYVSGHGRRTCKLCVRVHTAQGVGHTVGSGTSSHVVGVERTTRTATRGYAEVGQALAGALLLIGTSGGVLEARGVGGVTRDGYVHVFLPHDGNTFANIVSTIAVDGSTRTVGVSDTLYFLQLTREIVKLSLYVGLTVDTADNHGSVLAKTVEDAAEGLVGRS